MAGPTLGSILLASNEPDRLQDWYEQAFGVMPNRDGFFEFGGTAVLIDRRRDVANRNAEPERIIMNFHVDDAHAVAAHLNTLEVTWIVEVEYRRDAWFGTLLDPDGNCLQIIELTDAYWTTRQSTSPRNTDGPLERSQIATRLPARDLQRARAFYADKLGLEPVGERPGGLRYQFGDSWFALFESSGPPSGMHTQMAFEVDDIDDTVRQLRKRGVTFEEYDEPGLRTVDGIATVDGNYPCAHAVGERAAWFHDSEGNLLAIGQPIR
jgi:catechol 2,3-dioxygenase-like lactoylglutathione lyase family enzyme